MSEKIKFSLRDAERVATELVSYLSGFTEKIQIAGSIRRKKPAVGDVEIVYIPQICLRQGGNLFGEVEEVNFTDAALAILLEEGVLEKRKNVNGSEMYGSQNKLVRHLDSGIPVDLFATSLPCWHNYLTCRTGGAEMNKRIATEAIRRGMKWNPTGEGFTGPDGKIFQVRSEEEVFKTVGLPYLRPEERI